MKSAYGGEQWQVTQQRIVDDGWVAVKNIQGIIFSPHERDFIFYADENIEYDSHAYQKRAEESRPGFDPLFEKYSFIHNSDDKRISIFRSIR